MENSVRGSLKAFGLRVERVSQGPLSIAELALESGPWETALPPTPDVLSRGHAPESSHRELGKNARHETGLVSGTKADIYRDMRGRLPSGPPTFSRV